MSRYMDKTSDLFAAWWYYHIHDFDLKFFEAKTLNMMGMEVFRWGYDGKLYLMDRDGPHGGIWDFLEAAHQAGVEAGEASRNEWDWSPAE